MEVMTAAGSVFTVYPVVRVVTAVTVTVDAVVLESSSPPICQRGEEKVTFY